MAEVEGLLPQESLEDFLTKVDEVTEKVSGLLDGSIKTEELVEEERCTQLRDRAKDLKREEEQNRIKQKQLYGTEGKGESSNYEWFCRFCFVEYEKNVKSQCSRCGRALISREERHGELYEKVEKLKIEKQRHKTRRERWRRWKKTQEMLGKSSPQYPYRNWDYWEPSSDEDEDNNAGKPVLPSDNPQFEALEKDMKKTRFKREERLVAAKRCKERGNACFANGDYVTSITHYEEGLQHRKDFKLLYTNKALAEIKLGKWEAATSSATNVLEIAEIFEDGYTVSRDLCFKALCRRALAQRGLQKWEAALHDMEEALKLFPNDTEALKLYERTQQAVDETKKLDPKPFNVASSLSSSSLLAPTPLTPKTTQTYLRQEQERATPQTTSSSIARLSQCEEDSEHEAVTHLKRQLLPSSLLSLNEISDDSFRKCLSLLKEDAARSSPLGALPWFCTAKFFNGNCGLNLAFRDLEKTASTLRRSLRNAEGEGMSETQEEIPECTNALLSLDVICSTSKPFYSELCTPSIRPLLTLLAACDRHLCLILDIFEALSRCEVTRVVLVDNIKNFPKLYFAPLFKILQQSMVPENCKSPDSLHEQNKIPAVPSYSVERRNEEIFCGLMGNLLSCSRMRRCLAQHFDVSLLLRLMNRWLSLLIEMEDFANRSNNIIKGECALTLLLNCAQEEDFRNAIVATAGDVLFKLLQHKEGDPTSKEQPLCNRWFPKLLGLLVNLSTPSTRKSNAQKMTSVVPEEDQRLILSKRSKIFSIPAIEALIPWICASDEVLSCRTLVVISRLLILVTNRDLEAQIQRLFPRLGFSLYSVMTSRSARSACTHAAVKLLCTLTETTSFLQVCAEEEESGKTNTLASLSSIVDRTLQILQELVPSSYVSKSEGTSNDVTARGNLNLFFSNLAELQETALKRSSTSTGTKNAVAAGSKTDSSIQRHHHSADEVFRSLQLQAAIPLCLECLRKDIGGAQRNAAIALARLAQISHYRPLVRQLHGFESLQQIGVTQILKTREGLASEAAAKQMRNTEA